jgi:hypothetical protein
MGADPKLDALRAFLRLGMFIGGGGLLLALVNPTDSGEFVVSVCSAVMGGVLVVMAALMIRMSVPRE